jgi:hypothetical protein
MSENRAGKASSVTLIHRLVSFSDRPHLVGAGPRITSCFEGAGTIPLYAGSVREGSMGCWDDELRLISSFPAVVVDKTTDDRLVFSWSARPRRDFEITHDGAGFFHVNETTGWATAGRSGEPTPYASRDQLTQKQMEALAHHPAKRAARRCVRFPRARRPAAGLPLCRVRRSRLTHSLAGDDLFFCDREQRKGASLSRS